MTRVNIDYDLFVIDPNNKDTTPEQLRDCIYDALKVLDERTTVKDKWDYETTREDNHITTDELVREVDKLGLDVERTLGVVFVEHKGRGVAYADCDKQFTFSVDKLGFHALKPDLKQELYDLLDWYARTPIDKRVPAKRCHLVMCRCKTQFTQAEIDEMGDIAKGFVKEEV